MRIGVTCYPTHGGSGVVATELGKCLAERGHEVHFITYDLPFRLGCFHTNIRYHGVKANHYSLFKYPPYDLALASRMAQVAKTCRLDLLHVHYAIPHAVAAVLAKQMVGDHLKIVTTLHGTDITVLGEDPTLRDLICFGIEKSDAVTAVSQSLVEQTYDLFPVEGPIQRIYNFVDTRVYYPRDVSHLRSIYARPEEKIILHLSNFRPVKRPQDVIAIFAKVAAQIPCRLLLVGEGPEIPKIMEWIEKLDLTSKVIFLGKQDEVSAFISLADLFLLPSEKESFGLAALEAMACGVPTIGSHTGGLPEVVLHGETGYLSQVGHIDEMVTDAMRLLRDQELYRSFSQAGIERAKVHFSAAVAVDQYEKLYERVLEVGEMD